MQDCRNVAIFFSGYFGRCLFELPDLVPLPNLEGCLFNILIDCTIFLSPFLDIIRLSMSTFLSSHS